MMRNASLGLARAPGLLPAVAACAVLIGASAFAQVGALTQPQHANVQLVIDNLNALVTAGQALVAAGPKGDKADQQTAELDRLAEISANLAAKLASGSIHSVPGLKDGKPPVYHHDDEKPSTARAVYCDDETYVGNGQCPEGDILVDPSIIDPGNGTAINETTLAGWEQKWTLVHVLAHEKMHEILIKEQVKILKGGQGWKFKKKEEQDELVKRAKRDGATNEKHQEVYEWQKNVLRWEKYVLEAQLKTLQAAKPPNANAIKETKDKIEWLKKAIAQLEKDMARATGGTELAKILGCLPSVPANGYVEGVIHAPGLIWTLEALRSNGVTKSVDTVASDWFGERIEEAPAHRAAMTVTMDESVLTAGEIQPQLCEIVSDAQAHGLLRVARERRPSALQGILGHVSIGVGVGVGGGDRRDDRRQVTRPPQQKPPPPN
jgi:hypothetical protein